MGTASGLGIAATGIADSAAGCTVGTSGSAQRSDQSTSLSSRSMGWMILAVAFLGSDCSGGLLLPSL